MNATNSKHWTNLFATAILKLNVDIIISKAGQVIWQTVVTGQTQMPAMNFHIACDSWPHNAHIYVVLQWKKARVCDQLSAGWRDIEDQQNVS